MPLRLRGGSGEVEGGVLEYHEVTRVPTRLSHHLSEKGQPFVSLLPSVTVGIVYKGKASVQAQPGFEPIASVPQLIVFFVTGVLS